LDNDNDDPDNLPTLGEEWLNPSELADCHHCLLERKNATAEFKSSDGHKSDATLREDPSRVASGTIFNILLQLSAVALALDPAAFLDFCNGQTTVQSVSQLLVDLDLCILTIDITCIIIHLDMS
jgi:hypothetical protein